MSMNNKQRWMGGVVLLGGGVLLAALLLKGQEEIHQNNVKTPERVEQLQQNTVPEAEMIQLQPLTVDVETEKRLLEEQRRAREKPWLNRKRVQLNSWPCSSRQKLKPPVRLQKNMRP